LSSQQTHKHTLPRRFLSFFFFIKTELESWGCGLSTNAAYTRVFTVYEIHIFELRNEEINVKMILAVINATYAVAKRKPDMDDSIDWDSSDHED